MEFTDILAVANQPGLFKYVAQSARGVIVESLIDGRRMNASSASKVSALAEISMYTESDDVPLAEIFTNIYKYSEGKEAISHKEDSAKIRDYFAAILPEYDRDRVHISDMKKCFAWYNILVKAGMSEFDAHDQGEEVSASEE